MQFTRTTSYITLGATEAKVELLSLCVKVLIQLMEATVNLCGYTLISPLMGLVRIAKRLLYSSMPEWWDLLSPDLAIHGKHLVWQQ